MLRKIVFLTFILFVSSNILGQDKVQLDKFEVNNILRTLFEVKSFNKDGKGKWKPNVYEWYKMPISDDGYCYTGIDTILYSTVNNEEKAVVIFETIPYNNGERVECHGCNILLSLATFTRNNNLWELTEFEKIFQHAGTWGYLRGVFEILKLGKDFHCLVFYDEGSSGMGSSSSYTTFYDLGGNGYNKVLSFQDHESVGENYGNNITFSDETTFKLIKSPNYYKIELTTIRNGKNITKRQLLAYSEESKKYLPVIIPKLSSAQSKKN
ncbi:hypothetical protein [Sediminibacterium sp.]|uniref:hypothetical protein n=1 Tax=Sediminibacterium sp. TaxID=1917865 RepID=UPI0027303440|nr:hypothetical protein [Sediminibacterium sp.]MDP2422309.1 hypothetical protein [Sediminibacterium sp.]